MFAMSVQRLATAQEAGGLLHAHNHTLQRAPSDSNALEEGRWGGGGGFGVCLFPAINPVTPQQVLTVSSLGGGWNLSCCGEVPLQLL